MPLEGWHSQRNARGPDFLLNVPPYHCRDRAPAPAPLEPALPEKPDEELRPRRAKSYCRRESAFEMTL